MNGLLLDLRYALRGLAKTPAVFLIALVAFGIVLGLGGALLLTRFLASLVFDVQLADPWVLGGVALLLALAGAAAAFVPAARVTRISPVQALQGD